VPPGTEDEKLRAFNVAFRELDNRIKIFTSLPIERLDHLALQQQLDRIGRGTVTPGLEPDLSPERS
jgi:hypothetical protein